MGKLWSVADKQIMGNGMEMLSGRKALKFNWKMFMMRGGNY